jgi:hypothetical protein
MNWDALGAIGEIIGAIAVLATLIYLAIQTRLTRKAVEESSQHAYQQATHTAIGMYSDWRRAVLATPQLATIMVKAKKEGKLDEDEQILFTICFQDLFLAAAASYRGVVHNTAGYDASIGVVHLAGVLRENPLAIIEWHNVSVVVNGISAEFVTAVNKELGNSEMNKTESNASAT